MTREVVHYGPMDAVRRGAHPLTRSARGRALLADARWRGAELEYLEGSRYAFRRELAAMVKRREVAQAMPVEVREDGHLGCWVLRLRQPVPAWRRALPWVLAGTAASVAVGGLAVWALRALFTSLAAVPWVFWLIPVLLLVGASVAGGGRYFSGTFQGRMH